MISFSTEPLKTNYRKNTDNNRGSQFDRKEVDTVGLSKTEFMRGMQCPKQLWLDTHKPELKKIPEQTQLRLDRGNDFGDRARAMFGPFVEITEYIPNTKYLDKRKMAQNTRNAMRTGENNICEASFDYQGLFCAVDILHRVEGDVWELYEVKDSPEVEEKHIHDAAYQTWVLDKCGIQLDGVYIVYHYDDELDPFEPVDVTEEAIEYAAVIEANVDRLLAVKNAATEIMTPCGEHCGEPYECWYKDYCFSVSKNE